MYLFSNNKKKFMLFSCIMVSVYILFNFQCFNSTVYAASLPKQFNENELKIEVERIYNKRSSAMVSGDYLSLNELFDTTQKYGQWALEHEVKRVKYLTNWSKERDIKFTNIQSVVRIKKIYQKGNVIKLSLEETYKFDYVYNNDESNVVNSFGVGLRHNTSLVEKNGKWVVYNDWYTDCFEDAMQNFIGEKPLLPAIFRTPINNIEIADLLTFKNKAYDRKKVVAYADKYCGAACGIGNNFKYNKNYSDFNGAGGDCTNFVSQVLGDVEGGGMTINSTWLPGSRAWANADGLKNFLIGSGRGRIIKTGTFNELTASSKNLPIGIVGKLQLGDLVAYEKGLGNIDHFAVVTGFDSHGYPLVNSHTTDRYHVPWDLGWGNKNIRFFLIHINR